MNLIFSSILFPNLTIGFITSSAAQIRMATSYRQLSNEGAQVNLYKLLISGAVLVPAYSILIYKNFVKIIFLQANYVLTVVTSEFGKKVGNAEKSIIDYYTKSKNQMGPIQHQKVANETFKVIRIISNREAAFYKVLESSKEIHTESKGNLTLAPNRDGYVRRSSSSFCAGMASLRTAEVKTVVVVPGGSVIPAPFCNFT